MQNVAPSGIPIITGNPESAPASFTRFALPFIWSLEEPVRSGSHVFEPVKSAQPAGRSRYFTPETAKALFERTRWFDLAKTDSASPDRVHGTFVLHIGSKDVAIEVAPPRIVLVESASPRTTAEIAKTGFLLVDVHFAAPAKPENAPTLQDLLIVNELFRYWRAPYDGHQNDQRTMPDGGSYSYGAVMKDLVQGGGNVHFDRWQRLLSFPVETEPGVLRRLVARDASGHATDWVNGEKEDRGWIAYTDERAFVWTCALTQNGAGDLAEIGQKSDPTFSGDWLRLLNVDRPSADAPSDFERKWVAGRTYERWKHYGTLYGFNGHSGAMLAEPCLNPPVWSHFGGVYFDQVLLLLYVRVSLFRFSERLAEISGDLAVSRNKDFAPFRELRRAFTFLTNLYRFPLLSSQQQGIEMYAYARRWLDIDDLFKEVQTEVETTHEMFELVSTSKMAVVTAYLTYFVLFVGGLATVMAFLAAEDLGDAKTRNPVLACLNRLPWLMPSWWLILFSTLVIVALIAFVVRRQRR